MNISAATDASPSRLRRFECTAPCALKVLSTAASLAATDRRNGEDGGGSRRRRPARRRREVRMAIVEMALQSAGGACLRVRHITVRMSALAPMLHLTPPFNQYVGEVMIHLG
jgi:hypothetical protein